MKKLLLSLLAVLCMGAVYAQTPAFTVDFTQTSAWSKVNGYSETTTSQVDFGGVIWEAEGWNNFNAGWAYVRGGAKNATSYPTIKSLSAVAQPISSVGVNVSAFRNGSVGGCSLEVADNADFLDATKYAYDGSLTTKGEWKIEVSTPAENRYYRITVTCKNTTKNNGVLDVDKVNFYSDVNTALGAIEAVEGEALYFNLQGQRVVNPENGNLYIRVQGGKAVKVIL